MGTGSFLGGKEWPGRDADPPPLSSAVGHERVDCTEIVYELLLLPDNTAVKHFYMIREQCEVLTGNL